MIEQTPLIERLRDHENEGVTGSDRFHLRNEAADALEAAVLRAGLLQGSLEAAAILGNELSQRVDDERRRAEAAEKSLAQARSETYEECKAIVRRPQYSAREWGAFSNAEQDASHETCERIYKALAARAQTQQGEP